MPRSRQLSALLIVFALALASCTDDGENDADPQPTTTQPSTTTTESPEAEDEQALRQLAEDWYEAYNVIFESRSSAEDAQTFLVDPYLRQFQTQFEDFVSSGNQTEISDRSSQRVEEVSIEGDRALVTECVVNANVLVDPNGEVLNDEVGARRLESTAVRGSDGWRFSERRSLGDVEEAECAE
jgi:hypothetical protein